MHFPSAAVNTNSNAGEPAERTKAAANDTKFRDGELQKTSEIWDAEELLFLSRLARRQARQTSSEELVTSRSGLERGVYTPAASVVFLGCRRHDWWALSTLLDRRLVAVRRLLFYERNVLSFNTK